jgi:hypothetical protein
MARPSREFAPAGDLLFGPPKSRQKAPPAKPPLRGALRCSNAEARAELAPLRSAHTTARSQLTKRSSSAPRRSALLGGLDGAFPKQPQQPTAKPASRSPRGIPLTPFSTAEERKALRACAKRTSRTDSVRLFDRSKAEGVPHGPSRPEYRREPLAQRAAVRSGGALCLLSGGTESRSPAGAKSPHGPPR